MTLLLKLAFNFQTQFKKGLKSNILLSTKINEPLSFLLERRSILQTIYKLIFQWQTVNDRLGTPVITSLHNWISIY